MTGEADEADLPIPLRAIERLDHAAASEVQVGIVVVGALVHLPEIEMIGLEPAQRFLELLHRDFRVAPVRADLRHEEHALAAIGNRAPHPRFAFVFVILPRIVQERDARIDGRVDDTGRLANGLHAAEVVATERKGRDGDVSVSAERTQRNHPRDRSKS